MFLTPVVIIPRSFEISVFLACLTMWSGANLLHITQNGKYATRVTRERLLAPSQIVSLAKKHAKEPFTPMDAALITSAGCAYWTLTDLSLIKVADLVSESGNIRKEGYLPPEYNTNGKSKYFFIGKDTIFEKALINAIGWRKQNKFGLLDRELFSGLDPQSYFFLKPDGNPFELTFRYRDDKPTLTQPTNLQRRFSKYYLGEGVSYQTLNESVIMNIWNRLAPSGQTRARKALIEMTGLTAKTLIEKTIREEMSIQKTLEELYR